MKVGEVVKAFQELVEWPEYETVVVVLGALMVNFAEGEASYLLVVGPPSSGKTELLRALGGLKEVFELSKLTPRTFISGYITKEKAVGKDKSLLVRLKNEGKKVLVLKDLTSILSMRAEERGEIFGQLREIADGYCSQPFGTGEEVRWKGKLGVLAGVTGAIDESFAMRQALGERFLQIRLAMGPLEGVMEKAMGMAGREEELREVLRGKVEGFFEKSGRRDLAAMKVEEEVVYRMYNLAHFVSLGRTGVKRNSYTKVMTSFPESEGPARLVKQLVGLGRGIGVCLGKLRVDGEVFELLRRVGRDTLPAIRERCLRRIWADEVRGRPEQTTGELAKGLGCSKETIRVWLEDLKDVGLLRKEVVGSGTLWSLSAEGFGLAQQSGVFERRDCGEEE